MLDCFFMEVPIKVKQSTFLAEGSCFKGEVWIGFCMDGPISVAASLILSSFYSCSSSRNISLSLILLSAYILSIHSFLFLVGLTN